VVARRRELVVDDLPEPVPETGDVLVALRACGICGSDLHTLRHAEGLAEVAAAMDLDASFDPARDYHLGHEWVAELLDLGPGTPPQGEGGAPLAPGDLVVSVPYLVRGTSLVPLGFSNDFPAGYAERFLLTAAVCVPVPNGLDHRRAALTEPLAVGLHAVERSGIVPGEDAVVVGCGPIGLALIAWLAARGIEPIVAADHSANRRALARQVGAHEVVDPREEPVVDAWRRVASSSGRGLRPLVIFEAVGVPGMIDDAVFAAPSHSRIVVAGVCMEPDTIRPLLAVVKELDLRFVYAYGSHEFSGTLRAIAEGALDVTPLVTGRVGFDGVAGAFVDLGRADHHVKVLVEPDGPPTIEELSL
jgi:threonine dehydrogenase-like Zn-dependent dehydrogenase